MRAATATPTTPATTAGRPLKVAAPLPADDEEPPEPPAADDEPPEPPAADDESSPPDEEVGCEDSELEAPPAPPAPPDDEPLDLELELLSELELFEL